MRQRKIRLCCLLALAALLGGLLSPALARERARVVRVAYPIQAGITEVDRQGNHSGYTYEYLEEIAQYTGWTYEFVQVPGDINTALTTLMEMVRVGEVDLMGMALYSEGMAAQFGYSARSYGAAETVLQIPYGVAHTPVFNSNIPQGLTVAVLSLAGRQIRELEAYCAANAFTPEYILCETTAEQIQAVRDGRADALLNTSFSNLGPMRTVARFSPNGFFFIAPKDGDPALLQDLDRAMEAIDQIDPLFLTGLYDKYFSPANRQLYLTPEERDYLQTLGTIRAAFITNQPPFQYLTRDGEPAGMGVDLLRVLAQELEVELELVPVSSSAELDLRIPNGDIHLVAWLPRDYEVAKAHRLSMTRPYLSSQYVLVTRDTVATSLAGQVQARMEHSSPFGEETGNALICPTTLDCMRAVLRGDATYTYVDSYTAHYYLNLPEYQGLKLSAQTQTQREGCFGVIHPQQDRLLSILNKAILATDPTLLQGIANANTLLPRETRFSDLLREHPIQSISILGGVFLIIILLLLLSLRQRGQASRKNALELKKHYQVYALTQEFFVEYDHRDGSLLFPHTTLKAEDGVGPRWDSMTRFSSPSPDNPEELRRYQAFVDFILSQSDGVHEAYLECDGGEFHWLRLALVTVFDEGGKPVYTLGKINSIDHEREEKEALLALAHTDSLTRLYNSDAMRTLVGEALEELKPGEPSALLMVDIDLFKNINDTYGHPAGDAALVRMADLLRSSFRGGDLLARPGGDEFLIYIRSIPGQVSLQERCFQLCRQARLPAPDNSPGLTISVGGVLVQVGDSYDEIYRMADQALYEVKRTGRNGYALARRK